MFSSDVYIYIYIHPNQGPTEKSQVDLPILEAGLAIFPASSCRPFDEAVPPLRGFRNVEKWGNMWQKWWLNKDLIRLDQQKNWDGPKKLGADQQKWSFSAVDGGMYVSTCKTEVWTIKVTCYSSYLGLMMEFMGWADFHVWFKLSQEIGSLLSFNQVYTLW